MTRSDSPRGRGLSRQTCVFVLAGLALTADRSPGSQARLRDLRDAYAFFEREWPRLMDRYTEEQADARASATRKERTA